MEPHEVLVSESQERMCAIVEPSKVDDFLAVCEKWEVLATVIGEVTDTGRDDQLARRRRGRRTRRARLQMMRRCTTPPHYPPAELDVLLSTTRSTGAPDDRRRAPGTLLRMAAAPNLCDRTWVTDQYDRYVRGNTVLAQPEDAGVLRIDEASNLGVAIAVTATVVSPGSIRTPARSLPSPRRTAMSLSPVLGHWR